MTLPLRIALLVDPLTMKSRGGRHAPALARELIELGHSVRGFGAPPGVIPRSQEHAEGLGLAGYKPDVLIAYDSLSPTAFQGARIARSNDAALILVEPGNTRLATPLYERLLQGIGERMWGRYVRSTTSRVVALDPVAREHSLEDGFDDNLITVLGTGVDLEKWRPGVGGSVLRRYGIRGRVLVAVGPLETSRGIEELIAAFAATIGQRDDWSLVLVGDGSGRRALRTTTERLGIASRVHWLLDIDSHDLPSLLSASTLFVAPAKENSPRVRPLLEAMASGLPILASNVARYRWAVGGNESGLLVSTKQPGAWEEALLRASSAPNARERWGIASRAWALKNLDWREIAQGFEGIMIAARAAMEQESEAS